VALIRALLLFLLPTLALAQSRVTVRAEEGLAEQGRQAERLAGAALGMIETDLDGLPRVEHVEVRLVKHAESIAGAAPSGRGAPEWASGTAYPDEGVVVVAMRGRDGSMLDWQRTLTHELAHLALGRALGGREPRWLTEGFAWLHSMDASVDRATTLFSAVVAGRVVPLWEIEQTFPAEENAASLAYAESYDFVSWLARRGRWSDDRDDGDRSAFRQFLAEMSEGRDVEAAAESAFGRRMADLETEWGDSLRDRYLWMPLGFAGGLVWVLGALLLVAGWLRRKHQGRATMRRWDAEEALERGENRLN
jgi:hypothetical protein